MELIERVKAILSHPKEEWAVIEAENAPYGKVLPYILVLSLIPAVAIFFTYWWNWHSAESVFIDSLTAIGSEHNSDYIARALAGYKEAHPFVAKAGIIEAVLQFVSILGGVYLTAIIINALTDRFGSAKDFNRAFALVAYSYTPLCIAGILYIYQPLVFLVPFAGLYGLYILYLGLEPQLKPAADKKTTGFVLALIVALAVSAIISNAVMPEIKTAIYKAQVKTTLRQ